MAKAETAMFEIGSRSLIGHRAAIDCKQMDDRNQGAMAGLGTNTKSVWSIVMIMLESAGISFRRSISPSSLEDKA
jgi:hypothetical protein